MNVFCPNCGSQNEASNKFCFKCGTSLAGVTPVETTPTVPAPSVPVAPPAPVAPVPIAAQPATPAVPPPAVTPPPVPPPAVAVPPPGSAGVPPRTRLPMPLLIGGLVAVLGIGAAVGIVLGLSGDDDDPRSTIGPVSTAAPSIDPRTPGPIVSVDPIPTTSGGPTPAPVTPRPVTPAPVTPAPTSGGSGGGTKTVGVASVAITVPEGWESESGDTWLRVYVPSSGYAYLESGVLNNPETTEEYLQADIAYYKEKYPDLEACGKEGDFHHHNGPVGRQAYICYTAKTQSGKTFPAVRGIFVATEATEQGTILYYMTIFATDEAWDAAISAVNPLLPSTDWKLYPGG